MKEKKENKPLTGMLKLPENDLGDVTKDYYRKKYAQKIKEEKREH